MNREILFRGKVKKNEGFYGYKKGEWIYGNYSYDIKQKTINIEDTSKEDIANLEVEPNTVGQYTELTDKNGTKIFEGDIVLTDGLINTKVVWDTDRLMWGLEYPKGEKVALYSFEKWDIEVVGNMFDNSELLGG